MNGRIYGGRVWFQGRISFQFQDNGSNEVYLIKIVLTQENTNKDILKLERGLGLAVEDVMYSVSTSYRMDELVSCLETRECILHSFGTF